MHLVLVGALLFIGAATTVAQADRINVVAAENMYGDIAAQLGGDATAVISLLVNPDQDPHEFEAGPATARAIARADLVVYNGADYDSWVSRLLSASPSPSRRVIVVADLLHRNAGDNPHLWYDPGAPQALAKALADALAALDPKEAASYASRRTTFDTSLTPIVESIARLRSLYAGTPVTATEPVFGYLTEAIGLEMRNAHFQLAVMNGTEPSAGDIAAFERDLRTHAVKALIYNSQTTEPLTERMRAVAGEAGVPVVAVTETEPPGTTYQHWVADELDALDRALGAR